MDNVLGESVRRLRRSSRRGRRLACVAVDGSGLALHAVSTYFIRRIEQHAGEKTRYKHFLKWLMVVDVDRQIILPQGARQGPWCDTRALPGLVDAARGTIPMGVVLADAEFDSAANHRPVRGPLGAQSAARHPGRGNPLSDAPRFSAAVVWSARQNRDRLLGDHTQAFGPSTRSQLAHADAASSVARIGF